MESTKLTYYFQNTVFVIFVYYSRKISFYEAISLNKEVFYINLFDFYWKEYITE